MQFNFTTIKLSCVGEMKNPKFIDKNYIFIDKINK